MVKRVSDRAVRRYLEAPVREDLPEKMVFVGGPRQVGKTTLALSFSGPPMNLIRRT
jgi:predicted AAA+ superfamily ATPase